MEFKVYRNTCNKSGRECQQQQQKEHITTNLIISYRFIYLPFAIASKQKKNVAMTRLNTAMR